MGVSYCPDSELAISDILKVLDSNMYIPEKRLYLDAIDKLFYLGYYEKECKNGEKVSLFKRVKK